MAIVPRGRQNQTFYAIAVCLSMLLACTTPLSARGKDQKKKKDKSQSDKQAATIIPMSDEKQIDYLISEMLGAWQVGEVDKMHQYYSDDVSVVNGGWAPPVMGWTKYAQLYKQERDKMQKVRMDRYNTYIWVNGDTAWACYQWDFSAVMGGELKGARGLTTLVLVKKDNRWLIIHDHSNVVETAEQKPSANPTPGVQQPQQQKPGQ